MELKYGSAIVKGHIMTDQVCLEENICVKNFTLLGITEQVSFESVAGIVGISPIKGNGNSPQTNFSLVHTFADESEFPEDSQISTSTARTKEIQKLFSGSQTPTS